MNIPIGYTQLAQDDFYEKALDSGKFHYTENRSVLPITEPDLVLKRIIERNALGETTLSEEIGRICYPPDEDKLYLWKDVPKAPENPAQENAIQS